MSSQAIISMTISYFISMTISTCFFHSWYQVLSHFLQVPFTPEERSNALRELFIVNGTCKWSQFFCRVLNLIINVSCVIFYSVNFNSLCSHPFYSHVKGSFFQ